MTTKVNRQTQFTNLAKHHNRCGLTDVETNKQFEDFPINIRNWKFPKDISKEEMYVLYSHMHVFVYYLKCGSIVCWFTIAVVLLFSSFLLVC